MHYATSTALPMASEITPPRTCRHLRLHLLLQPDRVLLWPPELRFSMRKEAHPALAANAVRAHLHKPLFFCESVCLHAASMAAACALQGSPVFCTVTGAANIQIRHVQMGKHPVADSNRSVHTNTWVTARSAQRGSEASCMRMVC